MAGDTSVALLRVRRIRLPKTKPILQRVASYTQFKDIPLLLRWALLQ